MQACTPSSLASFSPAQLIVRTVWRGSGEERPSLLLRGALERHKLSRRRKPHGPEYGLDLASIRSTHPARRTLTFGRWMLPAVIPIVSCDLSQHEVPGSIWKGSLVEKIVLKVALLVTAALIFVGVASAATVRGITPVTVAGSPTCSTVGGFTYSASVKFSPPVNGATADGVHIFFDGTTVGWYVLREIRDLNIRAVIVKGGPNGNVYVYPGGDYSDDGLQAPLNTKNGKPYTPGYVTFCYDVATS